MPVPQFQDMTLPLLELAADGQVHTLSEARASLATAFGLTEAELAELLPSGRQTRFANRVAWAKVYLEQAGLVSSPARGQFSITARGLETLKAPPERITIKFLERFPEFAAFRTRPQTESAAATNGTGSEDETPEEALEAAYQKIRRGLAARLIERVKAAPPQFFEQLVVELLLKMGYGGARKDAGEAIGRTGDEGIDGIISEDRLGLDQVYLQAKRWDGSIGRPEVQRLLAPFTASARERACSLQPVRSRLRLPIMSSQLTHEWF